MKVAIALSLLVASATAEFGPTKSISTGPRPYFLIDQLSDGELKRKLASCADQPMYPNSFSLGHRGASLLFPEHTRESAIAAARMGAGTIECDVTFTSDLELVCRHGQEDLHSTTNILLTDLAKKCTKQFTPYDPVTDKPATAECRTTDITLVEFKTLRGKMDGVNSKASTVEEFVQGTARFRTDLFSGSSSGHLMTLEQSIDLFESLGVMHTPEAKWTVVDLPYKGLTRDGLIQKIIDTYKKKKVDPKRVFLQSFFKEDILYILKNEPTFGSTAVYLDDMDNATMAPTKAKFEQWSKEGIKIWAPPLFGLLQVKNGVLVPSQAALDAKKSGLDIIAWSLDRSGIMADEDHDTWYVSSFNEIIKNEGILLEVLHVLAQKIGVKGVFADWPATTSYYANCFNYGTNPVRCSGGKPKRSVFASEIELHPSVFIAFGGISLVVVALVVRRRQQGVADVEHGYISLY